ncbi:arabinose ABC transporter permease [Brevibacillus parabrevis]|uniref:MFS transporter n=1 Tax=Brevibacillus parabrevis TaxID=54914 RepID=UPI0007AB37B7|nr:MFS transporter [Brevibacillus parabrevis]KZE54015.1 arabinose ABC transporter permease [Brevibacillus parabrevis]
MNMKKYLYVNALSSLGSRMDLIACSALIFTFEHSAFWLMAFFVARQVGGMLFSPFAGILADRMDRRQAMIASDIGAGLALLAILFIPHPYVVVAAAFLKGMLYTLFAISFQASLPQMFGREKLAWVNSLKVRLESFVGIVGFLLGGLLTDHVGYALVIGADAASFLFSAAILTRMRWESRATPDQAEKAEGKETASGGMRAAFVYLQGAPVLLAVSLLAAPLAISTASHNYGLPFLADGLSRGDATLHGLMWSAMSAGGLVGAYFAVRFPVDFWRGLFGAYGLMAMLVVMAFAADWTAAVLLLLGCAGLFSGAAQVYEGTLLQQAKNEVRGKVLGVQGFLGRSGFFIGFLGAPPLTAACGLFGMVVCAQVLLIISLVGLGVYVQKSGGVADSRRG